MTASGRGRQSPLSLGGTQLVGGFWGHKREVNRERTIALGPDRLEEAGNFYDLRLAAGRESGPYKGPVYQDSDVYKWLEAVGWERARPGAAELTEPSAEVIALIAEAQASDGYLNSYYQMHPETERFSDLAHGHELYCAGHLIQAAIAHYATSSDEALLKVALRFADYLVAEFGPGRREGVCGHPEIEMALVELYRLTGNSQYLTLAKYFIDARGYGLVGDNRFGLAYYQDAVPVREATRVVGHAVRALYLAAGATDVAVETGDDELFAALERQWTDMVENKTYITGGMGARWEGESFGEAYELPNDRAYCETCAAIASVFWSWRLLLATGQSKYADLIERTLFNGVLSGLSLDGERFFYVNPLQLLRGDDEMSSRSPGRGRQAWFGTACCPTNLMRFISSVEQYFWTRSDGMLRLQQFASGTVSVDLGDGEIELRVATDYPWAGRCEIEVATSPDVPWTLSVRIPNWCLDARLQINGEEVSDQGSTGGYRDITRTWKATDVLVVELAMPVRRTRAPRMIESAYKSVALERGPLVYCVEQTDLPADADVNFMRVADGRDEINEKKTEDPDEVLGISVPVVFAEPPQAGFPYAEAVPQETYTERIPARAIPYFSWANRGVAPMRIWIPEIEQS